jgi:hypothetical protein
MTYIEKKPNLIIVPDDEYAYGIENGFYPELYEDMHNKEIAIVSQEKVKIDYLISNPKANGIYIRDPYLDRYLDIEASKTEDELISSKSLAIREVLVALGVYSAKIEEEVTNKEKYSRELGGNVGYKIVELSIDTVSNKTRSLNISNCLTLDPYPRKTKDIGEVKDIALKYGVAEDSTIKPYIDRLERDGELVGSETLEIKYLTELKDAFSLASNLKIFKANFGFHLKTEKSEEHTFIKKLTVCFTKPL